MDFVSLIKFSDIMQVFRIDSRLLILTITYLRLRTYSFIRSTPSFKTRMWVNSAAEVYFDVLSEVAIITIEVNLNPFQAWGNYIVAIVDLKHGVKLVLVIFLTP